MLARILRFLKFLYYTIITLPRDISGLYILGKTKKDVEKLVKTPIPVSRLFRKWAKKYPNRECIVFDDQIWTFQDVNQKI